MIFWICVSSGKLVLARTIPQGLFIYLSPMDTLFASGTASEHFTEVALTKEIVENRLSKKTTKLERIETDLLRTALENHKAQVRHRP